MLRLQLNNAIRTWFGTLKLKKLAIIFGLIAGLTTATEFSHFRFVRINSPKLALAPFGYTYNGHASTGLVYDLSEEFRLSQITSILRGKKHGLEIFWHDNGLRSVEGHFDQGLESGSHKAWYPDGSVKSFKSFRDGVAHGEFFDWHTNGQLSQYVLFDQGREVAAKSWTPNGKPFYNYVWQNKTPVGLQGDTYCSPRK